MHHKKRKAKNARAGCLMCKPNKVNGANKQRLGHAGFGKLRTTEHAAADLHDSYWLEIPRFRRQDDDCGSPIGRHPRPAHL